MDSQSNPKPAKNRGKVQSRARGPGSARTRAATEIRYRTLKLLEAVLLVLVERHGSRITLGEMLAVTATMARLCKRERVPLTEIAEATGLPKQNLSRWLRKRVGHSVYVEVGEHDQRIREIGLIDPDQGRANIEQLAGLLGTNKA